MKKDMKFIISFSKRKILFIIFGLINVLLSNIILQILLLFNSIVFSTFFSQLFNFSFGFYFYGKNVFSVRILNQYHFLKYLCLNIILWNSNWLIINHFSLLGYSKNLIALLIIPLLALISYSLQRYIIFI